jgi:Zn-dependent protease/CBS domain-containing protein
MHATVTLGRVAGVEIGANWTWLLVFGLIVWSLGAEVFPTENPGLSDGAYATMAVVAALLFFTSLVLHELGHAVTAQREGMQIEGITLWVFGGVAKFKGMFPSAGAEFRIAIAGPLVTLVIGSVLILLAALVPLPTGVDGVVAWLGRINLVLLIFNMLPALPLDGGRVLRSLLWRSTGDFTRATLIAGGLGRTFGQVMIFGGVAVALLAGAPGGLWLALIGWFLTTAARAEASLATTRAALAGMVVAEAMASEPVTVPSELPVAGFVDQVFSSRRHAAYPVTTAGRPVGLLSFRDVAALPHSDWDRVTAGDAMRPLEQVLVLSPTDELADAAMWLVDSDLGRGLVVDAGALVGLLSITDVSRLLELRRLHGPALGHSYRSASAG